MRLLVFSVSACLCLMQFLFLGTSAIVPSDSCYDPQLPVRGCCRHHTLGCHPLCLVFLGVHLGLRIHSLLEYFRGCSKMKGKSPSAVSSIRCGEDLKQTAFLVKNTVPVACRQIYGGKYLGLCQFWQYVI